LWWPRIDGDVPRYTRRPREKRMAGGGMERTGSLWGFAGRTARGARKGARLRGGLGGHVAWGRAASGRGWA
jgi:hypothetical protein